ncbi:MAG: PIN domain-containing protein [Solirubrobacterales bacterium]|nr:PIN domain-containing protein [Solirubrobacterales bacterium]
MAVLVLDAGVLIAHERGDRAPAAWLDRAAREGVDIAIAAPTITEVWRGGPRQTRMARLLNASRVVPCDRELGRAGGELLASAGSRATLDAIVVATAGRLGGAVVTDDMGDLIPLGAAAGVRILPLRGA